MMQLSSRTVSAELDKLRELREKLQRKTREQDSKCSEDSDAYSDSMVVDSDNDADIDDETTADEDEDGASDIDELAKFEEMLEKGGDDEDEEEDNVARMTESNPMRARFSSLEELHADILTKGSRDLFVEDLAKNHGRTPDALRKRKKGYDRGVIYAIICRVDLCVYVGQTNIFDIRMSKHFDGRGHANKLRSAINEHGRENFVCVILLAGIKKEQLTLAEVAVIKHIDCFAPVSRDYNMNAGGGGPPPQAVVITIYNPLTEITYLSSKEAAKAMCSTIPIISKLVNSKILMHTTCKGGAYANAFFTARFRDHPSPIE
jgi:hypothetical protein